MGICISYRGALKDPNAIDQALSEVREFCDRADWKYEEVSEHYSGVVIMSQAEADGDPGTKVIDPDPEPWPERTAKSGLMVRVSKRHPPALIEETVRGMYVVTPDTDSLRLVFDRTGRLVHYMDIPPEMVINAIPETNHYIAFGHFAKTQGATASHAALCLLLHILKRKYMPKLRVRDDSGFYQSGSLAKLEQSHADLGALIGVFSRSKDVGGLLRSLGADVGEGEVKLISPIVGAGLRAKKTRKISVN